MPDGYFNDFPERLMVRLLQEDGVPAVARRALFRPWMALATGVAAVLVIGWIGFSFLYIKPVQEVRFQESLALIVDFYGEELHEGELAGYFAENELVVEIPTGSEVNGFIQIDPGLAEQYIYESVGF